MTSELFQEKNIYEKVVSTGRVVYVHRSTAESIADVSTYVRYVSAVLLLWGRREGIQVLNQIINKCVLHSEF